jgi:arylsulfatase A-like enzyme
MIASRVRIAVALLAASLPLSAQTPPVTGGLKVWLDASSLIGFSDGDIVGTWPDLASGMIAGDAAQDAAIANGAGAPKFVAADPLLGGKPAVAFANGDALGFAGSLGLSSVEGEQPFTVFIVATNSKTAISPGFSLGDIDNGVSDGMAGGTVKCDLSTSQSGLRFNNGSRLFGPSFEATRYRVGLFRMGSGETYGDAGFRSDNRVAVQGSVSNGTRAPNFLDEGYHVGGGVNSGTGAMDEFMNGGIAEILFYQRELTEPETNQVGLYLEQKYGLDTRFVPPSQDARPNVVVILMDDMGWSDLGCYGGEARTPRIDSLASGGLRFRNFHNTARCSTTRAALLTGAYTHQVAQVPGGSLPDLRTDNNITIPEVLRESGYRTYMAGKWHIGSDPAERTTARGFQHVYGFGNVASGAGADYWDQAQYSVVSQNGELAKRTYPAGTFYQSDAIADHTMDFLDHHIDKDDDGKFFLYLAYNPPHFPMQAPSALADTYMTTYAQGWDVVRQARYDRMLAAGVIDASYVQSPFGDSPYNNDPVYQPVPEWTSLDADRRADLTRRMALYSAMIEKVDESIGQIVDRLDQLGMLENTIVMLMSDNGGNAEGGVFGKAFDVNNHPALTGAQLANMGQAGANDDIFLGGGWANVNTVPFRYYKRYSHEGGIRTPLIVHWPAGIEAPGRWTDQNGHLIDVMATVTEATGTTVPATFAGHPVVQPEGESLLPIFRNEAEFPRQLGYEHESTRAWVDGDWKLVTKTFASTDGSSPAHALELYDLSADPTELNNLAAAQPQRVKAMVAAWNAWASRVGVPQGRLLQEPLAAPASLAGDLFVDNFDRPNATDADASAQGMSGSRVPPLGMGAAYYEGFEGSGTPDSIQTLDGTLHLAVGIGMAENGLRHNFVGQDIVEAGGFSVQMAVRAINDSGTQPADRFVGFGVGLRQTEAAGGGDIAGPNTFRGNATNPAGKADFFVELDLNGNVKAWSKGVLVATAPVGSTTGTLTAKFELDGFTTSSNVVVTVFFNGKPLDLNTADPNSITRGFTWDVNQTNYIGLSARTTGYGAIDNLAIRKLPLAEGFATEHAVTSGLSGDDSAPGADPDNDGRPNFLEWAIGTDPHLADAGIASLTLLEIAPGEHRFRFETRRLSSGTESDVDYVVIVSDDLEDWTEMEAVAVSPPQPIAGSPGYESVEMELPAVAVEGMQRLFVIIDIKPAP